MNKRIFYKLLIILLFLKLNIIFYAQDNEKLKKMSLIEFVNLSYYNAKEIKFKEESLRLKKSMMLSEYRKLFPSLSLNYGKNQRISRYADDSVDYSFGFSLNQVLFDGGRQFIAIKNREIQNKLEELELKKFQSSFLLSLINFYFSNFLLTKEELAIKKEFLELQKKELNIVKKQRELKEVTPLDVYEWEISVKRGEIELRELNEQFKDLIEEMKYMVGFEMDEEFVSDERIVENFTVFLNDTNDFISSEDETYYLALDSSIDIKKMELNRQYLSFLKAHQSYNFIPQIEINFGGTTSGKMLFSSKIDWVVGVNISFPFFFNSGSSLVGYQFDKDNTYRSMNYGGKFNVYDTPSYLDELKNIELQISQLEEQQNNYKRETKIKVKNVIRKINFQKDLLEEVDKEVALLVQKVNIQAVKYRLGEERSSDYIKSLLELQNAKLKRAKSLISLIQTIYEFKFIKGDMLTVEDIEKLYSRVITNI